MMTRIEVFKSIAAPGSPRQNRDDSKILLAIAKGDP
jgi:hypothetical protein